MIYKMWPGRTPAGLVPNVRAMPQAVAGTFKAGEIVVFTSGLIDVSGADPGAGTIVGVALQNALTGPGYQAANSPATTTGQPNWAMVAMADQTTEFVAKLTNGSSTRVAALQSYIGGLYGVTAYSTVWTVDINKTTTSARVLITGVDLNENFVYFKFLPKFIAGAQ